MSKRFRLFYTKKNLLFLFYIITFTKHLRQFIYYTHFFIKIIFFLTFSIISHLPPPNTSFLSKSLNTLPSTSSCPYLYLCLSFFSFFFLFLFRIFFFPLLLLQFGFYTFIIDDNFGLGLIKGSDFRAEKAKFWSGFFFPLLQHLLLLLLLFSISVWLFIWICKWVWWIWI